MEESAAALRPLDVASTAIETLEAYDSMAELRSAIVQVREAVEDSLRRRLRADRSAPEEHRLSALSPRDLPLDDVVRSLRTRDLLSLETAGTVHELEAAAARARAGQSRAADADVAMRAVAQLRKDFGAGDRASVPPGPPGRGGGVAPAATADADVPPERRGRWMAWLGAGLAVLAVVLLALVLVRGGGSDYEAGVAAFRAGRLDSAAVAFQRVLEERPADISAMLYVARIHRRQAQMAEAAAVLRRAARIAPGDPDVRRELGHLLMELGQPRAAVAQYERALESDPEEVRTWAALIRALQAAGDPRAERLLADAPAEVQALLERPTP